MTEVLGETDIDWLTLIDYEQETECSLKEKAKCNSPVKWRITTKCCDHSFCLCNPCKVRELDPRWEWYSFDCEVCGKRWVAGTPTEEFFDVIPI